MSSKGRIFDRQMYDAMLASYRELPGNMSQCAKRAGVDYRTAERAWKRGWPRYPWARPIREVLEEEAQEARRRRAEQRLAEEAKKAEEQERQAEETKRASTQEGQLIQVVRANAIGATSLINRVIQATLPLAARLEADLAKDYAAGKVSTDTLIRHIGNVAKITRLSADASRLALEITRIQQGAPLQIVGTETMTPEQVADEMAALERTLKRARAAGLSDAFEAEEDEDDLPRSSTH